MANKNERLRSKFALLINYLLDTGFTFEYIREKMVHDSYFLFFEKNDVDSFLDDPIETIIEKVFLKKSYIDYSKPLQSEIFWAGQMYITLLFNYRIPLQRSLLIYPIEKMVSLFNPFHEMNSIKLCEKYLEDEKRTSILKILIEGNHTIKQLSYLTNINQNTLLSYLNNERLFSSTLENASALSNFFNIPLETFLKESNYCPEITSLLLDDSFKNTYLSTLSEYLSASKDEIYLIDLIKDKNSFNDFLSNHKYLFDISRSILIKKYNNTLKFYSLTKEEIHSISKKCIKNYKKIIGSNILLF